MLVFDQLRAWIEEGVLAPDEVIRDMEIADALGVSRTPVREALQMLEQRGVIETVPGRLTRVAGVSQEQATLVYPPLAALQAVGAELGTPNASPADLAAMRQANEDLLRSVRDERPDDAWEADHAFHSALVRCARNPFIESAIDSLRIHTRRLEILYFNDEAPASESHAEHLEIISAVEAGLATRASDLTRQNFLRGRHGFAHG